MINTLSKEHESTNMREEDRII